MQTQLREKGEVKNGEKLENDLVSGLWFMCLQVYPLLDYET